MVRGFFWFWPPRRRLAEEKVENEEYVRCLKFYSYSMLFRGSSVVDPILVVIMCGELGHNGSTIVDPRQMLVREKCNSQCSWKSFVHVTLWLFSIAMENGLFIDDFPIEPSIYKVFSMAMLNNQMVVPTIFRQRST